MSCNCGKPKCKGQCGCKSPAVLQINNPSTYVSFHKVTIPASMGDSKNNPPENGRYRNVLVFYEADQTSWLYSSDGIPTKLTNGVTNYEDATNLPQINGHTLIGNQTSSELGLQGELIAGENIWINDNVISSTDTVYTAGRGISLNDNEFSANIATDENPGIVKPGIGLSVQGDGSLDVDTPLPGDFFSGDAVESDCGGEITLENTIAGQPKTLEFLGNTSQESYSGKNKIYLSINTTVSTLHGITPSYDQSTGLVNVSGTSDNGGPNGGGWSNIGVDTTLSLPAGNYVISTTTTRDYRIVVRLIFTDNTYTNYNLNRTDTYLAITTTKDVAKYRIYLESLRNTPINDTWGLMLESGSVATQFEKFVGGIPSPNPDFPQDIHTVTGEQTIKVNETDFTIDLGDTELAYIGDYRDRIKKENGNWVLYKQISKVVLNGSGETWLKSGATANVSYYYASNQNASRFKLFDINVDAIGSSSVVAPALSDKFTIMASIAGRDVVGLGIDKTSTAMEVRVGMGKNSVVNTAELFTTWLGSNPVTLYYPCVEERITITDEDLIAQLNAIELETGANVISVEASDLAASLCISAYDNNWNGVSRRISDNTSQISDMSDKIDNVPYGDSGSSVIYTFFDEENSNRVNFFVSEDGVNLRHLVTDSEIQARDPSLLYKNGKYYLAVTSYSSTYNFIVYVSEDLNTWIAHKIDVGLYDETYPKVWAPEWFEDTDGKIYLIISKQYADTEGWGDFHPYIVECTDLESMEFGVPQQMILNGALSDNHIDGAVAKIGSVYHLIIKSDHQTELILEHYVSSDLINWTLQDIDPMRFGRLIEGPFIYQKDGVFYVGAERYSTRVLDKSYYIIAKTTDFVNFSNNADITYADLDISHGSGVVVPNSEINKLLNTGKTVIDDRNKDIAFNEAKKDFHIAATCFTDNRQSTGNRLGDYLHLFDVNCSEDYRVHSIVFHIATSLTDEVDATYRLNIKVGNGTVQTIHFSEDSCLTSDINNPMSLAGSIFAIRDDDTPTIIRVYLETAAIVNVNQRMLINYISTMSDRAEIIRYTDAFTNTVPTVDSRHYARGSSKSQTVALDNTTHPYARIVFGAYNGAIQLIGHENSISSSNKLVNALITVNNGNAYIHHLNPDYDGSISVTVESYDNTNKKREYTLLISGITNYSALEFIIPNTLYSYIKSLRFLDSV